MRSPFFRSAIALSIVLASACSTGIGNGNFDGALIPPDGAVADANHNVVGPDGGVHHPQDAGPGTDAGPGCQAAEICGNGLDDNCNGVVEDDCPCLPGETMACFRGRPGERGIGLCADGTMVCTDGIEFGTWGPCEGDVLPADETCDAAEQDENCDGAVNEGCECTGSEPLPCGSDVGACGQGLQECIDGHRGACIGATEPMDEVCNGIDDNCDGNVDEGIVQACGSSVGECRMGTQTCVAGTFEACTGGRGPVDEICDGLDNDCDGMTDEMLTRSCGSSVGACMAGTQTCSGGSWSTCTGETLPSVETCNNVDDDCDGVVDDGVTQLCGSSTGACMPGTQTCSAGAWGTCTGGVGPAASDTCGDGIDNDCDGSVDEGCLCTANATRSCGTDVGACTAGTQTCNSAGTSWGTCTGATGPTPEVCNRIDDDCDGMTDEDGVCPTSPPTVMCPGAMSANVLSTVSLAGSGSDPDGGSVTYAWTVTTRPTGSASNPSSPSSASTNFYLDASGNYVLQLCVTDDEGESACCTTPVTSVAPGNIHVELNWSTAYGDVDLHFLNRNQTDPNGWWTADDCDWQTPAPDWGPIGAAGNPTLDIDDTNGYGPENTTINTSPVAGTYTVGIHYFCSHSIGTGAAPGDGPTSATVRVYCGGALIATYSGLNLSQTDDWLTVAEVDYPSCVGRSRSRRTTGRALLPAGSTLPRHCEIPCTSNANCLSGERCASVTGPGGRRNICVL